MTVVDPLQQGVLQFFTRPAMGVGRIDQHDREEALTGGGRDIARHCRDIVEPSGLDVHPSGRRRVAEAVAHRAVEPGEGER